uniref:Uncharacterized protein n=1 Tax=Rhizophora mucronata TaxID=61149 RepID=A0A2P2QSN7_RHIMU
MAGLQYNFFPTDFLYPRPQSSGVDATQKANLPLQVQKIDAADDRKPYPTSLVVHKNVNKAGNKATAITFSADNGGRN